MGGGWYHKKYFRGNIYVYVLSNKQHDECYCLENNDYKVFDKIFFNL